MCSRRCAIAISILLVCSFAGLLVILHLARPRELRVCISDAPTETVHLHHNHYLNLRHLTAPTAVLAVATVRWVPLSIFIVVPVGAHGLSAPAAGHVSTRSRTHGPLVLAGPLQQAAWAESQAAGGARARVACAGLPASLVDQRGGAGGGLAPCV